MKIAEKTWDNALKHQFSQDYFIQLEKFLDIEYASTIIYPARENLFAALELCPFDKVRVVILGQDPYINPLQAHGLAFSVASGFAPPSLKNIFKEIARNFGTEIRSGTNLTDLAVQGVLLLNLTLSVRHGASNSHAKKGWEIFTSNIISLLNDVSTPIVFMLWGASARKIKPLITASHHLILEAAHPSPLARNKFSGCLHFSKANEFLQKKGLTPIKWG